MIVGYPNVNNVDYAPPLSPLTNKRLPLEPFCTKSPSLISAPSNKRPL